MNSNTMTNLHQTRLHQTRLHQTHLRESPFVWPLAQSQAVTLTADPATRAFWVHEGRVWLTRPGAADVWLDAGQFHTLPAGSEWVVEAWPQARVSVVQAAPAVIKSSVPPTWLPTWLSPWRAVVSTAWRRA